jgi:hypothetical protein
MNSSATTPSDSITLKDLRDGSGKSLGVILSEVKSIAPDVAPSQRSGIIHWERQGITKVRVIRVLSQVYGLPFETVEAAALESKRRHKASHSPNNMLLN